MKTIHVAVLRGGPSTEHDVSLKTGTSVIKNLPAHYHAQDVVIDREGVWHVRGIPREPHEALAHAQVVVNALHGQYGEDGKVQSLLDTIGIPYTGSGSFASALGMNKALSKKTYEHNGIRTPKYVVVRHGKPVTDIALELFRTMPMPVIMKPVSGGSSIGISIARDFQTLVETLTSVFAYGDTILVEEYIQGKEATVGVVQDFRGQDLYALMPIEIIHDKTFFDYESKYAASGDVRAAREICPGNFSAEEKKAIEDLAIRAHQALGLSHYSRSDFIIHPKRGVYILETNTLPGLTESSLLPKALAAGGTSMPEFLDHLVSLALERK